MQNKEHVMESNEQVAVVVNRQIQKDRLMAYAQKYKAAVAENEEKED